MVASVFLCAVIFGSLVCILFFIGNTQLLKPACWTAFLMISLSLFYWLNYIYFKQTNIVDDLLLFLAILSVMIAYVFALFRYYQRYPDKGVGPEASLPVLFCIIVLHIPLTYRIFHLSFFGIFSVFSFLILYVLSKTIKNHNKNHK